MGEGQGGATMLQILQKCGCTLHMLWPPRLHLHAARATSAQGADTPSYAHEAGYDAYMTGAAFACLLRLYEASGAGRGVQQAPQAQQAQQEEGEIEGDEEMVEAGGGRPGLEAVAGLKWRMNISRWVLGARGGGLVVVGCVAVGARAAGGG